MIARHLDNFISLLQDKGEIELYNEAGLQHELGFYLKSVLNSSCTIQLERNISAILGNKKGLHKNEIDIFIKNGDRKIAIELKMPVNKQIPKRMELTFKDVRFLEQLKTKGFDECYLLFTSNVKSFWESRREQKIYAYFNDGIIKTLYKEDVPVFLKESKDTLIPITNEYEFTWKDLKKQNNKQWRYFILDV